MEYEVKVLDINTDSVRKKLTSIGSTKIHDEKMFKRNVFYLCDKTKEGFARVRDEGANVTMTTKVYIDKDYPEETEVSINEDFEKASKFMESIGLEKKSFQETIREKYSHPLAHEITIDSVPGIPSYMEIDCNSKANLDKLIEMLEVDKTKIRTGGYDKQFLEYYDIPKSEFQKTKSISFRNVKNEIFPKKNKEIFDKVVSSYTEKYLKKTEGPLNVRKTVKRCPKGNRRNKKTNKCVKK